MKSALLVFLLLLGFGPVAATLELADPGNQKFADSPPRSFTVGDRWLVYCIGTNPPTTFFICEFHDKQKIKL